MLYEAIKRSVNKNSNQHIESETETISYAQLLEKSANLVPLLTGQKYGIICQNKVLYMTAIIGCLQAHRTAVLLCPEYGDSFCEMLVKKAGLKNFIIETEGALQVITKSLEMEKELDNVALIIHTSGSTGTAKGVMLTQRQILSNIRSTLVYYPISCDSTVFLYRPIYHTTTVCGEFLMSLLVGAKMIVVQKPIFMPYFVNLIKEKNITNLAGTPTFFAELIKADIRNTGLPTVRVISVGGERISKDIAECMLRYFKHAQIYQCYGMTEASPRVTYLQPEYFGQDYRCIGKPLNGVSVTLKDEERNEIVTPKMVGEICVSGENIMCGYYREPEMTARVFENGWYHTGDYGFRDEEGRYYILGRKDQLCIRAGVNVWLQEIENALLENPYVESVYVYCVHGIRKEIVAQVQCPRAEQPELMKWCVQSLPKPYIPDRFEFIEEIVVSGCGKRLNKEARGYNGE